MSKIYLGELDVLNGFYGLVFKINHKVKKNIFVKNFNNLKKEDKGKVVKFILTTEYAGYDHNGHVYIDYGTIIS